MEASIGIFDVRLFFFRIVITFLIYPSYFYRFCSILHNLIRACILDHVLVMLPSPFNVISNPTILKDFKFATPRPES